MVRNSINRRQFLILSGSLALATFIGISCDSDNQGESQEARKVFRLSSRGRRTSQAAKKHNANKLFATEEAANENRAHPGDNSQIVCFTISESRFNDLFDNGNTTVVDLRNI